MQADNRQPTISGERGQIPPSTSLIPSDPHEQRAKLMKRETIAEIVAELGIRFQPPAAADREAFGRQLALLIEDLDAIEDVDAALLDRTAKEWARRKAFMPKASELRNLALALASADELRQRTAMTEGNAADRANARLAAEGKPPLWEMRNGVCELIGPPRRNRNTRPLTRVEVAHMAEAQSSLRRALFDLGFKNGWIVADGFGGFVDSETVGQ